MQTKVQAYVQLADETSLKITGNYLDWLSFLTTASRLYKYPYHDQLMIYAQRPDASACAAYELWNGTIHAPLHPARRKGHCPAEPHRQRNAHPICL